MPKVNINNQEYAKVNNITDIEIGKRVVVIGVRVQFGEESQIFVAYNWQLLERLPDIRNVEFRDSDIPMFRILLTNDRPAGEISECLKQYDDITSNSTKYPIYIDNGVIQ